MTPVPPAYGPAAVLLVDALTDEVVYANGVALRMSGAVQVPVAAASWVKSAGVRLADGTRLDDADHRLVDQLSVDGVRLVARPDATEGASHDATLWGMATRMEGAPGTLERHVLVVLLPQREEAGGGDDGADLQRRAALASELSFTISDPQLPDDPIVWVNPSFTAVTGYTAQEVVGRNCRFLQGEGTDPEAVARIRTALSADVTIGETLLNYRKDGTPFWNQVVISPVFDELGNVTHRVGVQAEVTAQVEADAARRRELVEVRDEKDRLAMIAGVTRRLSELTEPDAILAELPALLAAHFGGWAHVVTVGRRSKPRAVVRTADAGAVDAAALLSRSPEWALESLPVLDVLRGGTRFTLAPFDIGGDLLAVHGSAEQRAAMVLLGLGSAMVVPLRARHEVLGSVAVVSARQGAFSAADMATLADIGHRAGLAYDNARLYVQERQAATALQDRMLPRLTPVEGLQTAATYLPASRLAAVGGDWFDVIALPDGSTGLMIGDVVGHDMHAAASMGQLRSVLRTLAWEGREPVDVVDRLDDLVRALDIGDLATLVVARLTGEPGTVRRLAYARAGHLPPLLRHPDGRLEVLDGALRTPVGIRPIDTLTERVVDVPPGALLVLYTDGLVERYDRSQRDGLHLLQDVVAGLPAGVDAEEARRLVLAAMVGEAHDDDLCLLVVRA